MKAARILSIIGLIVGIILGLISLYTFFAYNSAVGSDYRAEMKSIERMDLDERNNLGGNDLEEFNKFQTDEKTMNKLMILSIISIFLTIIAGVLGFRGPNKKPINIEPKYLSLILLICGIVLLILQFGMNFIHAILYIIAAVLYFIHYIKNKQ